MKPSWLRQLVCVALVAGLMAGCSRSDAPAQGRTKATASPTAETAQHPNIVLISIDTLRPDALGSYGHAGDTSPVLDRLAREGVRFGRAYSTASWTAPALASLLTGVYPSRHGVVHGAVVEGAIANQELIADGLPRLAGMLKRAGYRTYAITANGHLGADFGFAQGFDRYECSGFANADKVLGTLAGMRGEIRSGTTPYFVWIHLLDPHSPYVPGTWLEGYWKDRPRFPELESVTTADDYSQMGVTAGDRLDYVRALYDGDVRSADDAVGRALQELGADDATLVMALSDHGEEFREHGRFGHGHSLFEESVRIPLIMRFPQRAHAGAVIDTPASLIDVIPTLADFLGLAPPKGVAGRSLLPAVRGERMPPRELFAELARGQQLKMIYSDGWKLIYRVKAGGRMLYDLTSDPGETHDLAGDQAAIAESLLGALRGGAGVRVEPDQGSSSKPLDAKQLQALRALGYVQ